MKRIQTVHQIYQIIFLNLLVISFCVCCVGSPNANANELACCDDNTCPSSGPLICGGHHEWHWKCACRGKSGWRMVYYKPSGGTSCGAGTCPSGQQEYGRYYKDILCNGKLGSETFDNWCNCSATLPRKGNWLAYETGPNGAAQNNTTGPHDSCFACCSSAGLPSGGLPLGVEFCGNGIDDNRDGRVDENCDLPKNTCNSAQVGEPVSLQTGNMSLQHTDFQILTGGPALTFSRTYNSQWRYGPNAQGQYIASDEDKYSVLSVGWRHSFQGWFIEQKALYGVTYSYNSDLRFL